MIAAKCEKCGTIGNCFCHKAICKNVTKGTCCGDWDENGICKLTIPPKESYIPGLRNPTFPYDKEVGKPIASLQPCQAHDKETEKEENTATKFDTGKPKLSYVPQLALWEVGKSFSYGAAKYAEFNYSKGMEYTRLTDAALRHINQALRGEDIDEESQCYHISNAIASLMMLLDNQVNNTIIDNRNKNYKK